MATTSTEYVVFLRAPQASLPTNPADLSTSTIYFATDTGLMYFLRSDNTVAKFYAYDSSINPFSYDEVKHALALKALDSSNAALGNNSFATGTGTRAYHDSAFSCGQFNSVMDILSLFSVGCGTSDSSRYTAFSIDEDGNAFYKTQQFEDIFSNILTKAVAIACAGTGSIRYKNVSGNYMSSPISSMASTLNPQEVYYIDAASTTDLSRLFNGCSLIQTCSLNASPMSGVTKIDHMFNGDTSLESVSGYNYDNVASAVSAFANCNSIESVLDVVPATATLSKLTDATCMFFGCANLTDMSGITDWTFGSNANTSYMFNDCIGIKEAYISNMPANIKTANEMFSGCSSLKKIYVDSSTFDCMTDCNGMFRECGAANIQSGTNNVTFNGSSVRAGSMFRNCGSVSISNSLVFNTQADASYMCASVNSVNINGIAFNGNSSSGKYMFANSRNTFIGNVTCNSNGLDLTGMFEACDIAAIPKFEMTRGSSIILDRLFYSSPSMNNELIEGIVAGWKGYDNITSANYMFANCKNLTDFGHFNGIEFTGCISAAGMFANSGIKGDVAFGNILGKTVETDMTNMFSGTGIVNMTFDSVVKCSKPSGMFSGCTSLATVNNLYNMTGPKGIQDFSGMFCNCTSLSILATTLQGLDSSVASNMSSMFENCKAAAYVQPLMRFNSSSDINCSRMFYGCDSVKVIRLHPSASNVSGTTHTERMYEGCSALQTLYNPCKIVLTDPTVDIYTFAGCSALVDISTTSSTNPWVITASNNSCTLYMDSCVNLSEDSINLIAASLDSNVTGNVKFDPAVVSAYDKKYGSGALLTLITSKGWNLKQ